jgi:hypothetical protein
MNEGDGRFSIAEFSTLTGLPEELLRKKINGTALGQAFFSIQELAARWRCSRATVYNRLRAEGAKVLDFSARGKKGRKAVSATEIHQIEAQRTRRLS